MNSQFLRSIRFRLTVWYTALLAGTFACGAGGVWFALHVSTKKTIDRELRSRLATVRTYVDAQTSAGGVSELLEELNEQAVMTPSATNLRIAGFHGNWFYLSPGADQWNVAPPDAATLPEGGRTQTISAGHRSLRIISAPVKIGAVQIGVPVDEFKELQTDFLWSVCVGAPLLLCLAAFGGFWLSGRALRPVDDIAETARRITSQTLSERLPGTGANDEIDRLSQVLNGMLDRLESAFQRIVEFTADASHELRTPIAVIRTTAEITQSRSRTAEEHAKAWSVVQAQAERTSELLADLLLLAREDAAPGEVGFDQVSLGRLVEEACDQMRVLADVRGITLLSVIHAEGQITGDGEALLRSLLIFVDNAIKFTRLPAEIVVSLDVAGGQQFVVKIADRGIGIPPEDLPRIFDRFYRATKDRSRTTGGSGLGLAIAHSIVTRHNGRIEVESELGKGSTFRIFLPQKTGTASRPANGPRPLS